MTFDDLSALTLLLARKPLVGARVLVRRVAPNTWQIAGVVGLHGDGATRLDVGRRLRRKALAAVTRRTTRRGGAVTEVEGT